VVTRLVPHKQLHLLVEAVPALLTRWPDLRVEIAGAGPARDVLIARARQLGVAQEVTFLGRVSEQVKSDLLSRAWFTVAPSLAEGWGLTVLEASSVGTPAVAYDVPGLRDSVRDGMTGWLVPPGQNLVGALTNAVEELADPHRQRFMADHCCMWAARFSWDATAERLAMVLLSEIARREQGSPARRHPAQLATVTYWPPDGTGETSELVRKALRVTDMITSDEDGVKAILMGCDELGAARALQRVPVPPAWLRLATTTEVLCGSRADGYE
jgi:hypothetical protein